MGKKEYELVTYWLLQKAYSLRESIDLGENNETKQEMLKLIDTHIKHLKDQLGNDIKKIEYLLSLKK